MIKYRDRSFYETDMRLLSAVLAFKPYRRARAAFSEFVKRVKKRGSMTVRERTWVVKTAIDIYCMQVNPKKEHDQ